MSWHTLGLSISLPLTNSNILGLMRALLAFYNYGLMPKWYRKTQWPTSPTPAARLSLTISKTTKRKTPPSVPTSLSVHVPISVLPMPKGLCSPLTWTTSSGAELWSVPSSVSTRNTPLLTLPLRTLCAVLKRNQVCNSFGSSMNSCTPITISATA